MCCDGGNLRGDFTLTLDMIDYKTGWSVAVASKNKAYSNVLPAIRKGLSAFPFPILETHPDNDAAFINAHFFNYCQNNKILFSRSRPCKKDDNFLVEKNNNSLVRKTVGYKRYEGEIDTFLLNRLYEYSSLYINFFKSQRRCIEKIRVGSKIKKRYDKPQTLHKRTLKEKTVSKETKEHLKNIYKKLNPIKIRREIIKLQNILMESDRIKKKIALKLKKEKLSIRLDFS